MVEKSKQNELISGLTHLAGAILSVVALGLLLHMGITNGGAAHIVGFSIFGASLILLYVASTVYHLIPIPSKLKQIFRRIDHAMIFVLIAGTYTPICLVPLWGAWGWTLLAVIWSLAITGVIVKALWIKIPGWLSGLIYLGMGWLAVLALPVMFDLMPINGVWWMLAGGIFYSVGVIFYALEKVLKPIKWFGMHEIFHIFVLAGSFSHFWMMWKYIAVL